MEQLGIITLRIGMKGYHQKFQDLGSKDESILEREKGQGYISIDGKDGTIYLAGSSPWRRLRRCGVNWCETGLLSLPRINRNADRGHATSTDGRCVVR